MRSAPTRRPAAAPPASTCSSPANAASGPGGGGGGLECRGRSGGEAITGMDVRSYIEENTGKFFDELKQWLTIPSISADSARHPDLCAPAGWIAEPLAGAL